MSVGGLLATTRSGDAYVRPGSEDHDKKREREGLSARRLPFPRFLSSPPRVTDWLFRGPTVAAGLHRFGRSGGRKRCLMRNCRRSAALSARRGRAILRAVPRRSLLGKRRAFRLRSSRAPSHHSSMLVAGQCSVGANTQTLSQRRLSCAAGNSCCAESN